MDDVVNSEIIHSSPTSRNDPFFLLQSNSDNVVDGSGPNTMSGMTICADPSSFMIGPSSSSSFATNESGGSSSGGVTRHENEYLKELADLLQDTLNRPDSLQGVDKPALMDLIKQLRHQSRDRKDNAVQHEDVSSSGPILLASHIGPMILEYLDGFFFVMNTDGFIEYISPNVTKYLKYNQADMLNKPIYNFVNSADHDLFSALLPDTLTWNLLDFNANLPSSSNNGVGVGFGNNKERKSHRFMCRFLENVEQPGTSTEQPNYQNLQVAAISLPLPASDSHTEDEFQLSFNVMMESQPCLVCVARRLPEMCMNTDYEGSQFSIYCAPSGFIYSSNFKDKSLKQLFPKDFHRVQIQHFCHSQDLALLNSILKDDRGGRQAQIRLISPVLKSQLLLQVRSKSCADSGGGNFLNQHPSSPFNYESGHQVVDTTANSPFVQLDFTMLRQNDASFLTSSSSSCTMSAVSTINTSNNECSPAAMDQFPVIYDSFGDMFFADEYLISREQSSKVAQTFQRQQQQQNHNFQQQQQQFVSPGFSSVNLKPEKFHVNNLTSATSNPVTPIMTGSQAAGDCSTGSGRCPSSLSEPVSSTGHQQQQQQHQDDLQRICQMFSISGNDTIDFNSPMLQQQQTIMDFNSHNANNLASTSNNYADYSFTVPNNDPSGSSTSSATGGGLLSIDLNSGKSSSDQHHQQHIILKELLNQEEQQQQLLQQQRRQQQQQKMSSSSSLQHSPASAVATVSAASASSSSSTFPPPPNLFPATLEQTTAGNGGPHQFLATGGPQPARGGRKQSKGAAGSTRRGGGTRKNSKKSSQVLESLLKPEFPPPPGASASAPVGSWCSTAPAGSGPPPLRRHSGSMASPPQILQQLLSEEESMMTTSDAPKTTQSVLGKRRSVGSRQQAAAAVRDFSYCSSMTSHSIAPMNSGAHSITPPATLGVSNTPSMTQKSESLLVQLLEKPLSTQTAQTRSLPTSIANTQFDKIAKENKENPSKQPIISTLIVESLLNKTKTMSPGTISASTISSLACHQQPPGFVSKVHLPPLNGPLSSSNAEISHVTLSPGGSLVMSPTFMQQPQTPSQQNMQFFLNTYNTGADESGFFMTANIPGLAEPSTMPSSFHHDTSIAQPPPPNVLQSQFPNVEQFRPTGNFMPPPAEMGNNLPNLKKQQQSLRFPVAAPSHFDAYSNMSLVLPSPSTSKSPAPRFQVTPTPSNVRQQILIQQQKRGRGGAAISQNRHHHNNANCTVTHSAYQQPQPFSPTLPQIGGGNGMPANAASFSCSAPFQYATMQSSQHQATLGMCPQQQPGLGPGPGQSPVASPAMPKSASFFATPPTLQQMPPTAFDHAGLPLDRDSAERSMNKPAQQIPQQTRGHAAQNRSQTTRPKIKASHSSSCSIDSGSGGTVTDFSQSQQQRNNIKACGGNKSQQNAQMLTYGGSLSLNQQMQKADWSFIERRIPENYSINSDSSHGHHMHMNNQRSQPQQIYVGGVGGNNFTASYPLIMDQQQHLPQQHVNNRLNEMNSNFVCGSNGPGQNHNPVMNRSMVLPQAASSNLNESTVPQMGFYLNGQDTSMLHTTQMANEWWNADVGLDNGPEMDDESTQNLLQMLNNS